MRKSDTSPCQARTRLRAHNVDRYIGGKIHTRKEEKRKLIQNERAAVKVQYLHVRRKTEKKTPSPSTPGVVLLRFPDNRCGLRLQPAYKAQHCPQLVRRCYSRQCLVSLHSLLVFFVLFCFF